MKPFALTPTLRTIFLAIFIGLTLNACNFAQKRSWHESGVTVQKSIIVQPFTSLNLSVPMDVRIVPSNQYRVVLTLDSAFLPLISMKNEGQSFSISFKKNGYFTKNPKGSILVFVDSLYNLKNQSVGNILFSDTLRVSHFNMMNEGVGTTLVMVVAPQISIQNSSVGKLTIGLKTDSLFFKNSAVGNTFLSGVALKSVIENSGVGSFNAKDMLNQTLYLKNSAVGGTQVYASKAFYVTNSAVGHLTLFGQGEIKELHDSGLSKTTHIVN